jgi:hypothetical protein
MALRTNAPGRIGRLTAGVGIVALLGLGGFALAGAPSGAATLSCPNFDDTDVPAPPPNTTGYLFIGTSISGDTSSITVMYTGGQQTVDGVQQGGGAFHYVVYIPQGATVTSATVTGATNNTVVTVSGCLNGPEVPSTSTPSGAEVSPESVTRAPTPAAAVVGAARFTG